MRICLYMSVLSGKFHVLRLQQNYKQNYKRAPPKTEVCQVFFNSTFYCIRIRIITQFDVDMGLAYVFYYNALSKIKRF